MTDVFAEMKGVCDFMVMFSVNVTVLVLDLTTCMLAGAVFVGLIYRLG